MRKHLSLLQLTGTVTLLPRLRRHRPRAGLIMVAAMVGATVLAATALSHPPPRLVYNASASAPLGFYLVIAGNAVSRGDLVLAALPDPARRLADERGYLPSGVPVAKRVAGIAGDLACAASGSVVLNGRVAAQTLPADREGRPLPAWRGCRTLAKGEVFLLNDGVSASFDGRYFGPIDRSLIIGRLVPLWTW